MRYLLLVISFSVAPLICNAQFDNYGRWEHGFGEPAYLSNASYSQAEFDALRDRWQRISTENRESANEWAGDYVAAGDVSRYVFRWSPQAGFAYIYIYTCLPEVRSFSYGAVNVSSQMIQTRAESRLRGNMSRVSNYLLVKWGERHYLVPESQVRGFYNMMSGRGVSAGAFGDAGEFFLRAGDYNKPVFGMPILPPGYERFAWRPISASITSVGRRTIRRGRSPYGAYAYSLTPITLNIGSRDGVRRSTGFHLIGSDYPETIRLIRIGRNSTAALIERIWIDGRGEFYQDRQNANVLIPYLPITTGLRLTTSYDIYHSETTLRR